MNISLGKSCCKVKFAVAFLYQDIKKQSFECVLAFSRAVEYSNG